MSLCMLGYEFTVLDEVVLSWSVLRVLRAATH
jgi:hypothetical protein